MRADPNRVWHYYIHRHVAVSASGYVTRWMYAGWAREAHLIDSYIVALARWFGAYEVAAPRRCVWSATGEFLGCHTLSWDA